MSSVNKVILVGRLTRDPEMRYTPSGQPVTEFSVATDRFGTAAEGQPTADFHKIVCWNIGKRPLAEIAAEHLKKGSAVYVEGSIQYREWAGNDGVKRKVTEIKAFDVQFMDDRAQQQQPAAAPAGVGAQGNHEPGDRDVDPDEIPF